MYVWTVHRNYRESTYSGVYEHQISFSLWHEASHLVYWSQYFYHIQYQSQKSEGKVRVSKTREQFINKFESVWTYTF